MCVCVFCLISKPSTREREEGRQISACSQGSGDGLARTPPTRGLAVPQPRPAWAGRTRSPRRPGSDTQNDHSAPDHNGGDWRNTDCASDLHLYVNLWITFPNLSGAEYNTRGAKWDTEADVMHRVYKGGISTLRSFKLPMRCVRTDIKTAIRKSGWSSFETRSMNKRTVPGIIIIIIKSPALMRSDVVRIITEYCAFRWRCCFIVPHEH